MFGWRDRVENIGKVDVLGRVAWGDHRPKPWVYPNRAVWVGKLSPTELVIPEGVMRQMRDGLAYARGNRPVFLMLLSFAAIACTALMELAPSIAATVLDGDLKTLSWMMSSFAVGALSAGIFIARWSTWPERLTIITTLTGSALSLVGYGACGYLVIALASAVLLGFAVAANNICVNSAIQMHSEPQYRGRITGLYNMVFKGGPAVGAAIFGWLAQITNVPLASLAAAVVLAALTLMILNQATVKSARKAYAVPPENSCGPKTDSCGKGDESAASCPTGWTGRSLRRRGRSVLG